jgi:hypothetical protein
MHGKAEAVPTGVDGSNVLAGGRSRRDVGGQARNTKRGERRGRPDEGLASGCPGASHALLSKRTA